MTQPIPTPTKIVIVDHDNLVPDRTRLALVAHALERQVNEHAGLPPPHGYGLRCSIRAAYANHPPAADEWQLGLFRDPDQPGALGYHDETPAGLPLMKVFPLLDQQDGVEWSTTASHEILEALVDPNLCRCAWSPIDGKVWAYEVGDAVEQDSYSLFGVKLSNFVLPPYFEPPTDLSAAKFDFMGLVRAPYEIRPGGYGQTWDGQQWTEHTHGERGKRSGRQVLGSRQGRRILRASKLTLPR